MTDELAHKTKLVHWESRQDQVTPDFIGKWHKGKVYNQYPDKRQLAEEGLGCVAKGWLPEAPFIGGDTRVLAVGSCFARHFTLWLAEHGYNRCFPESPYNALLRYNADFESPAVIAQQFRWAFGELDADGLLWIDRNRRTFEATEEGRLAVRSTLEQTDVLIMTLGLSEIWYDNTSGEPLWRALTENTYDPGRHVFRVESVSDTIGHLECIERLRMRYLPGMKAIYTLSPIPLKTTFRPVSAVTANAVSKAILRAALDEFLRRHETLLNRELFYYPSYEMTQACFIDPYREDNRHLAPIVPGHLVALFARFFCSTPPVPRTEGSLGDIPGAEAQERFLRHAAAVQAGNPGSELLARIAELEEEKLELQRVCDERQQVIGELDRAARERLALIERLDADLRRAQASA